MSPATQAQPLGFVPSLLPEDQARVEFYALLARLWYDAPDRALLAQIAGAEELVPEGEKSELAASWRALASAAAAADEEAVRDEYDSVFVGTGKAEVTLYAAGYRTGAVKDRLLVQVRDALAALGLARQPGVHEPEDHLAALLDVMRHLAAQGSHGENLARQKTFFNQFLADAYGPFTRAAMASANTRFYQHVARFTKAFLDLEVESFEML